MWGLKAHILPSVGFAWECADGQCSRHPGISEETGKKPTLFCDLHMPCLLTGIFLTAKPGASPAGGTVVSAWSELQKEIFLWLVTQTTCNNSRKFWLSKIDLLFKK